MTYRAYFRLGLLVLAFVAAAAFRAHAGQCSPEAVLRQSVIASGGTWIEMLPEQWQFLRGIYAMNPLTPPGLPVGDRAALARAAGSDSGKIIFIDGDRACSPMAVPKTLIEMLDKVKSGKISHEGDPT